MKYILTILILLIFSCTKQYITYNPATFITANKVELISDTTVNGTWDLQGKTLSANNYKIHGTGTIINTDLDFSVNQVVFDTSINLKNVTTAKTPFSTIWYGTSSTNADNWWNIQKSINVCRDNHLECFTPGRGIYKYSKTLDVSLIVNNAYKFCSIKFTGDASYWDMGSGTTFQYTGLTGPAFNMQLNKGSIVQYVSFKGTWKAPVGTDSVYFNIPENGYVDKSGLADDYTGIAIDYYPPFDGHTISGSTGITMQSVSIQNFGTLLYFTHNGITLNDEAHTINDLHLGDGKYGIVSTQAQSKAISVTNLFSWGSIYSVVNIGLKGRAQAGNFSFDIANIAGRCIEPINISQGHWFSSSFNNWFCESIGRVGTFLTQIPLSITNSTFDLNTNLSKQRIVFSSNSPAVNVSNSTVRYYDGLVSDVVFHGAGTFNNCYFGGGKILWK